MANLRLIIIDELGEDFCFKAYTIPCVEDLTRDEVEAFKEIMLRRCELPPEKQGWYWIEDFTLRSEVEEEERLITLAYGEYIDAHEDEYDWEEDLEEDALRYAYNSIGKELPLDFSLWDF